MHLLRRAKVEVEVAAVGPPVGAAIGSVGRVLIGASRGDGAQVAADRRQQQAPLLAAERGAVRRARALVVSLSRVIKAAEASKEQAASVAAEAAGRSGRATARQESRSQLAQL